MLRISNNYRITSGESVALIETLKKISNNYTYIIIKGLDAIKESDKSLRVKTGKMITIDSEFLFIDNVSEEVVTLDENENRNGQFFLVIERIHDIFTFRILHHTDDNFNSESIYSKYAIVKIFDVVDHKITNLYDVSNNVQITKFNIYTIYRSILDLNNIISGLEEEAHTHPNKEILDEITEAFTAELKDMILNDHVETELNTNARHTHLNKNILDYITAYYTIEEKQKLASLESSHFKGIFQTLESLENNVQNPIPGDYAYVDAGENDTAISYIWDPSDNIWVKVDSNIEMTPARIKQLYESNPDTNAFTDADKTGLETHLVDYNNPHQVTTSQIGAATQSEFENHVNDHNNPHNVTAEQIGLESTDDLPEGSQNLYYTDDRVANNPVVLNNTNTLLDHIEDHENPHQVTAEQVGAPTYEEFETHIDDNNNPHNVTAYQIGAATNEDFQNHINDHDNPHQVTTDQIGAANQSDLYNHTSNHNNPHQVTTSQIGAANQSDLDNHISDHDNPHQVTTSQIGAANQSDFENHVNDHDNPHNVTISQIGAASQSDLNEHLIDYDNPHNVTAAQIGSVSVIDFQNHVNDYDNPHNVTTDQIGAASQSDFDDHISDHDNPHNVTTDQIGAATQSDLHNHTSNHSNPHNVTTDQIGAATQSDLDDHISDHDNPHNVTAFQLGANNLLTEIKKVDGDGSGLNADKVDGFETSQDRAPNSIVVTDSTGYLNKWINIDALNVDTDTPFTFKNLIVNGDFRVNRRNGLIIKNSSGFFFDRIYQRVDSGSVIIGNYDPNQSLEYMFSPDIFGDHSLEIRLPFNGNINDLSEKNHVSSGENHITYVPGKNGTGAYFNGKKMGYRSYNAGIHLDGHVAKNKRKFTLSCWVKGRGVVFQSDLYRTRYKYSGWGIFTNRIFKAINRLKIKQFTFNHRLDDRFHHFAVTVDHDGSATVYIDGTQIKSRDISGNPYYNGYYGANTGENIGAAYNEGFTGIIDDFMVFNRILTSDEIYQIYSKSTIHKNPNQFIVYNSSNIDLSGNKLFIPYEYRFEGQDIYNIVHNDDKTVTVSFMFKSNHTGKYSISISNKNIETILDEFEYNNTLGKFQRITKTFDLSQFRRLNEVHKDNNLSLILRIASLDRNVASVGYHSGVVYTTSNSTFFTHQGDYIVLSDLQMEHGDKATDFQYVPLTIQEQICKRYYQTYPDRVDYRELPVDMRVVPHITGNGPYYYDAELYLAELNTNGG